MLMIICASYEETFNLSSANKDRDICEIVQIFILEKCSNLLARKKNYETPYFLSK